MIRNKVVRSLEEELSEIGLDPEKTLGAIHRTSALVEARLGGVGTGGGAPGYLQPPAAAEPGEEAPAATGDEDLEEAFKLKRVKRKTAGMKLLAKRAYRKGKSKSKKLGKAFRKRFKRKIARARAIIKKKFGGKPRRKGFRVTREHAEDTSPLAALRESLNDIEVADEVELEMNAFCETALNAGTLAEHFGEMFEAAGDEMSAERMFDLSDAAADLALEFAELDENVEELEEDNNHRLGVILDGTIKGLRLYEGMDSPSLGEVFEIMESYEPEEGEGDLTEKKDMSAFLAAMAKGKAKGKKKKGKDKDAAGAALGAAAAGAG